MLDNELFASFRTALIDSFAVVFAQESPPITIDLLPIYNNDYSDRQGRVENGYMTFQTIMDTQRSFGETRESLVVGQKLSAERWRKDVQFNLVFRQDDRNSAITIDWWLYFLQRALQTSSFVLNLSNNNIGILIDKTVRSMNKKNENNNYEQFRGFEISLFYDRDYKENITVIESVLDQEIEGF